MNSENSGTISDDLHMVHVIPSDLISSELSGTHETTQFDWLRPIRIKYVALYCSIDRSRGKLGRFHDALTGAQFT